MTDKLEGVLEAYLRSVEAGTPADREALVASHPDLAVELAEFFQGQDWMHQWVKSARKLPAATDIPCAFGKHRLLKEAGRGGMGVVYKAQESGLDRIVALKLIRSAQFASPAEVARFRLEAEAAAGLDHPHIVPIHEFGEHDGQPYFTMKWIEGGSLQHRLSEYQKNPRAAARLMSQVARAVRYAHRRAILHRDLKPGNILVDADGEPHITDFGLAKKMDGSDEITASGEIVGTLAYMAPEQAAGNKNRLSLSVDIHGMGAVLYALLTGRAPFSGATSAETLRKVQEEEPADPRTLNPGVDADLSAICLKCLQKDPARRYETAGALAEDLEHWLAGLPVQARHLGRGTRLWRWSRRNALGLALATTISTLLVAMTGSFLLRSAEIVGRRKEILKTNASMAQDVASRFLYQIRDWGKGVQEEARQPRLKELLRECNKEALQGREKLQAYCEEIARLKDRPFQNWHILDQDGIMVARTPKSDVIGKDCKERDYFQGTRDHQGPPDSIHVSSVYHSIADRYHKFNICVQVLDNEGCFLGVIAVAITTDPTMGISNLQLPSRKVALVAPRDPNRRPQDPPAASEPAHYFLLHPDYASRVEARPFHPGKMSLPWPRNCAEELSEAAPGKTYAAEGDYLDLKGGRQFSGFAPVGHTGFFIIIQSGE